MFNYLWEPLIPHITAIGLVFDVVGILVILLENFFPVAALKIDKWLADISYSGFTERLSKPLFFSYDTFYKYCFIPTFLYFLVAVFYDFEMVEGIIKDKGEFIVIIATFLGYFVGYITVALIFISWIIPLLYLFSSQVIYKNKPLSGTGFMLIIIGVAMNIPLL